MDFKYFHIHNFLIFNEEEFILRYFYLVYQSIFTYLKTCLEGIFNCSFIPHEILSSSFKIFLGVF